MSVQQLNLPPPADRAREARDLVRDLLQILDDRMTKAGHPAALVLTEHRGTCPPYECSARCKQYRALFVHGIEWLEGGEA